MYVCWWEAAIKKACRKLRIRLDTSLPGLPRNNSLIERCNQDVTNAARAALLTAGLPACFWEFAAPHVCMMDNTVGWDKSPYALTHGTPFNGHRLPLGCLVRFLPASTKDSHDKIKWDSEGQYGIFAGYKMKSGCKWSGSYLVWHIDEFKDVCLARDAHSLEGSLHTPHTTDTIWVKDGHDEFPLKDRYDKTNSTVEGREEARRVYHDDSLVPPDLPRADAEAGGPAGGDVTSGGGPPSGVVHGGSSSSTGAIGPGGTPSGDVTAGGDPKVKGPPGSLHNL